jgi:hypothetical protein
MVILFLSFQKTLIGILQFQPLWFIDNIEFLVLYLFLPKSFFGGINGSLVILNKFKIGNMSFVKVFISFGFFLQLISNLINIPIFSFNISLRLINLRLMFLFYSFKINYFLSKTLNLNLLLFIFIDGSF